MNTGELPLAADAGAHAGPGDAPAADEEEGLSGGVASSVALARGLA